MVVGNGDISFRGSSISDCLEMVELCSVMFVHIHIRTRCSNGQVSVVRCDRDAADEIGNCNCLIGNVFFTIELVDLNLLMAPKQNP